MQAGAADNDDLRPGRYVRTPGSAGYRASLTVIIVSLTVGAGACAYRGFRAWVRIRASAHAASG
jgi:hypothetical protein